MKVTVLLLSYIRLACCHTHEAVDKNPYHNEFGDWERICPKNANCLDGTFNYLCAANALQPSPNCKRYVPLESSIQSRDKMTLAHNGLRNDLAYKLGLANMNLVYWNGHLQRAAEQYLNLCRPYRDTCLIVGYDGVQVGHNTLFVAGRNSELLREWEARAVRHWFLKMGAIHLLTPAQLMAENPTPNLQQLRQLIWPSLEFIGCSGAKMFNGIFIVCYYYPPSNKSLELSFLESDRRCICPKKRVMCSLVFRSLCGIDLISSGKIIKVSSWIYGIIVFALIY